MFSPKVLLARRLQVGVFFSLHIGFGGFFFPHSGGINPGILFVFSQNSQSGFVDMGTEIPPHQSAIHLCLTVVGSCMGAVDNDSLLLYPS